MKKIFTYMFVTMLLGIAPLWGQLKVSNNGNVTIKPNSSLTPLSALSVGDTGEQNVTATVFKSTNGYDVGAKLAGQHSYNWDCAVYGYSLTKGSYFHVGIWGTTFSNTANSFGRAFGVLGKARNSTSGYNYGVFGTVGGSNNGAGVVGTINDNKDVYVPGMYAGYFVGNVRVTGTVTAQNLTSSDSRLKENVSSLSRKKTKTLNSVISMNPVEYNLKQVYTESSGGDSVRVQKKMYDEKSQQFQKKHFGLIAQELKEIYPDLVYEEDDGYLSVDYTGLIPILIQSIKELREEIDNLRDITVQATNGITPSDEDLRSAGNSLRPFLYHNAPNPFKERTEIKFFVPENVKTAQINIYSIQGALLKEIRISQRGEGTHVIYGSEFSPGVYLYALFADNRQVDVKKMVLSK